jgi:hypothetical protein
VFLHLELINLLLPLALQALSQSRLAHAQLLSHIAQPLSQILQLANQCELCVGQLRAYSPVTLGTLRQKRSVQPKQ